MVTILTMAQCLITRFVQQVLRLKMSTFIGRLDLIFPQSYPSACLIKTHEMYTDVSIHRLLVRGWNM